MLMLKAIAVWLAILVCAILNGALREGLLVRMFGKPAAPLLSGTLLCLIILGISWFVMPWFGRLPAWRYILLGVLWVVLTLAFEFAFGLLVQNQSWTQLLQAYTFKDGNLWSLVVVVIAIAPLLSARLRGLT